MRFARFQCFSAMPGYFGAFRPFPGMGSNGSNGDRFGFASPASSAKAWMNRLQEKKAENKPVCFQPFYCICLSSFQERMAGCARYVISSLSF